MRAVAVRVDLLSPLAEPLASEVVEKAIAAPKGVMLRLPVGRVNARERRVIAPLNVTRQRHRHLRKRRVDGSRRHLHVQRRVFHALLFHVHAVGE